MKLLYHTGKNFGDALNPLIFNYYLGSVLNNDDSECILGIGSILGLKKPNSNQIFHVISSGFADGMESTYGKTPVLDEKYNIIAVRGPLTAHRLGLDKSMAVVDGASLLFDMDLFHDETIEKEYECSFIPHIGSEQFYNYKPICEKYGINYISPSQDVNEVLLQIKKSKHILAEAMHGAIVADALRVKWHPVKFYKTINKFKWNDWSYSLEMGDVNFSELNGVFNKKTAINIYKNKFKFASKITLFNDVLWFFIQFKINLDLKKIDRFFKEWNTKTFKLSSETILKSKVEELKHRLVKFLENEKI